MGKAIFFVKGSLLVKVLVKALEAVEVGGKSPFFKYLSVVGFYWILTYIWYILLCKIAQLQESEMRLTG